MSAESAYTLAAIRDAARARAGETSLRATADEIGMSYTGLRAFLGGGSPQTRTRRKLVEWYVLQRRAQRRGAAVNKDDLEAAFSLLEVYLRAGGRPSLRERRVREISRRLFGDTGETGETD